MHHQQGPLNRDRHTLPQDSMLHYWPDCTTIWSSSNECVITVINLCFAFPFRLCIRFYWVVSYYQVYSITTTLSFSFFVVIILLMLVILVHFLTFCPRIPHMTTSSSDCPIVFVHACKCQLFTDEGSRRLLKHLNYCFSVLASTTNQSINYESTQPLRSFRGVMSCKRLRNAN